VLRDLVYSSDGQRRAVITEDQSGTIRLRFEWWDLGDLKEAGVAYWSEYGQMAHIVDSVGRAQSLAASEFHAYASNNARG
jgi:hypothetical protein